MLVLLIFCIIHDVASINNREHNGVNRQLDKETDLNDLYRSILEYKSDGKHYKNNDFIDDYFEREPRRLFDWLKDMIKTNTSYRTSPLYGDVVKERMRFREIEKNLTDTLSQLSSVLNQILNIVKFARHDEFRDINDHLQHALDKNKHISKRNVAVTDIEANKTEVDNKNETVGNENLNLNDSSGRRALMGSKATQTTNEVKDKLFNYINEGFTDIKNKINSLKPVKTMFSKDIGYEIGYIVANIDTLQANMGNLKNNMDVNQFTWSDKKILKLYDTVKLSNKAVTNLIDVLKDYIQNSLNSNY